MYADLSCIERKPFSLLEPNKKRQFESIIDLTSEDELEEEHSESSKEGNKNIQREGEKRLELKGEDRCKTCVRRGKNVCTLTIFGPKSKQQVVTCNECRLYSNSSVKACGPNLEGLKRKYPQYDSLYSKSAEKIKKSIEDKNIRKQMKRLKLSSSLTGYSSSLSSNPNPTNDQITTSGTRPLNKTLSPPHKLDTLIVNSEDTQKDAETFVQSNSTNELKSKLKEKEPGWTEWKAMLQEFESNTRESKQKSQTHILFRFLYDIEEFLLTEESDPAKVTFTKQIVDNLKTDVRIENRDSVLARCVLDLKEVFDTTEDAKAKITYAKIKVKNMKRDFLGVKE